MEEPLVKKSYIKVLEKARTEKFIKVENFAKEYGIEETETKKKK